MKSKELTAWRKLENILIRFPPMHWNPVHITMAKKFKACLNKRPLPHHSRCRKIDSPHKLKNLLSSSFVTISGEITPLAALRLQEACNAEISFDRVIDLHRSGVCCAVTRGVEGLVASNVMFYYALSIRFIVLPIFHTHKVYDSDIGHRLPSSTDYISLRELQRVIGKRRIESKVYLPDGSHVTYYVQPVNHATPFSGFRRKYTAFARHEGKRDFIVYPNWDD